MKPKPPPAPTPKRAIGYVRVSTNKQDLSPEAQAAKVRAFAALHDYELVDIVTDTASGKTLNRPAWQTDVAPRVDRRSVEAVIVAKLDRLTRSVGDLADLLELFAAQGVALVSVAESLDTSTAAGRLVMNVMTSVAQWEREAIGERTRDVIQHNKTKAIAALKLGTAARPYSGQPPFGFKVQRGRLVADDREQAIVRELNRLRAKGWTLRQLADRLNARGYRTRTGAAWQFRKVHHILTARARMRAA